MKRFGRVAGCLAVFLLMAGCSVVSDQDNAKGGMSRSRVMLELPSGVTLKPGGRLHAGPQNAFAAKVTSISLAVSASDMTTVTQTIPLDTLEAILDIPSGTARTFTVDVLTDAGTTFTGSQTVDLVPGALIDVTISIGVAGLAPTGVTATAGAAQVTLAWDAVAGAAAYNIYWGNSSGVTPLTGTKISVAANSYTHTALTPGASYYYVVTAVNAFGETAASAEVSAVPTYPAPSAPASVNAAAGDTVNTITWSAVAGATSYNIYWSVTPGVTAVSGAKISGVTSPYLHTGLSNGTTYYYIVTAVNGVGESVASTEISATPQVAAPAAPAGVTAIAGDAQVVVSWSASPGATSYNVYYSTASGVTIANGTKVAGATSGFAITGLTNGTAYYFVVTAINAGGESAVSAEVSTAPQVAAPAAPADVTAIAGDAQVVVSWTAPSGTVSSYNVYYSTTSGVTIANGTKVAGATSGFAITGLTNGTTYYFVVTAVNAGGESVVLSEVFATPQVSPPIAPAGVGATAGNGQVAISWTAVNGAISYNIYYKTSTGVTSANGTKVAGATSGGAIALANGTTYYFVVTAVNAGGEGAISSEVAAIPQVPAPGVPGGLAALAGNAQVSLTWTAVAPIPNATITYTVYRSTSAGVVGPAVAASLSAASYTDTGAVNGTTYYYNVAAVDAGGTSAASGQVSATPQPPAPAAPTGVTVTGGNGQVTVNWVATSGANTYNVYYRTASGVTAANGTVGASGVTSTSTTVSGLTNGTTYYFIVTAVNGGGEGAASGEVASRPGLPGPIGLAAASAGSGTVKISWNPLGITVANVSGSTTVYNISGANTSYQISGAGTSPNTEYTYNIYWSTVSGVTPFNAAGTTTGISNNYHEHTGLTNGTTYYYVVTAIDPATSLETLPSAEASAVAGGNRWFDKAPMPAARMELSTTWVDGILYAVGGELAGGAGLFSTVEAYNPNSNTWTAKAPMNTPRYRFALAEVNGILYAIGGYGAVGYGTSLATVEAYNPATNTWTAKASMPTARGGLSAAVVDGIIYAIGGDSLTVVEAYDPVANTWSTKAPMPTGRGFFSISVVNGTIYAVGGGLANGLGNIATVEAYSPASNAWTAKASMLTARGHHATAVLNGTIYAFGGITGSSSWLASVEAYDPVANTWSALAPMPSGAKFGFAASEQNGTIFLAGGYNGSILAAMQAYAPAINVSSNTWSYKTSMISARSELAMCALNGKIYVIGGYNGSFLSSMEEYDTATGVWTNCGTTAPGNGCPVMSTPRAGAVCEISGGKIYVMGGYSGATYLISSETYDPSLNTWSTMAYTMSAARYSPALAALNGRLYVMGGTPNGVAYANTVDIFDYTGPPVNQWTSGTAFTTGRQMAGAGAYGGKIFLMGGFGGATYSDIQSYDPISAIWSGVGNMPAGLYGFGLSEVNGLFYLSGGSNGVGQSASYVYDPAANTWKAIASMPATRWYHKSVGVNGKVYVAGGAESGAPSATLLEYTP